MLFILGSACNAGDSGSIPGSGRYLLKRRDRLPTPVFLGFPYGSAGIESACNVGDLGWEDPLENSYLLQYSGLENSMDCIVYRVTKILGG